MLLSNVQNVIMHNRLFLGINFGTNTWQCLGIDAVLINLIPSLGMCSSVLDGAVGTAHVEHLSEAKVSLSSCGVMVADMKIESKSCFSRSF